MKQRRATFRTMMAASLALMLAAHAQAKPGDNEQVSATSGVPVAGYQAVTAEANIAPTVKPAGKIDVSGQPRMSKGHPCTLWDQQDIDQLKQKLKTDKKMQESFDHLKSEADARIAKPLDVPEPTQNQANQDGWKKHEANVRDISDLGILYALTGDAKYGEYAKKMLLAYAKGFPVYSHPANWTPQKYRSACDGRLTGQFLADGFWLCHAAFGYDLIHDLPSWKPEERASVQNDLLLGIAKLFYNPYPADPKMRQEYISAPHNRSALCASGVLMAGYASDNQDLVNLALYGDGGSAQNMKGGAMGLHFSSQCITPAGLWVEGSIGYQIGIASCGLFNDAETAWHHGIDLYRYNNCALKRLLDSSIGIAYPDKRLTFPVLHDSAGRDGALADVGVVESEVADQTNVKHFRDSEPGIPFELGYIRYGDPSYIPIFLVREQSLSMTTHAGPPSPFVEVTERAAAAPRQIISNNYADVGYGVLRVDSPNGGVQLLIEFGPSGGHGHPSKLAIDAFALGDSVMPMCGVYFPYDNPLDKTWFHTTLANNVLEVDETDQLFFGNDFKYKSIHPEGYQLVFGPASTIGIQKCWSNTLYPFDVTQDRAVFLTPEYYADIYGAFSNVPHKYDMAWHVRGEMTGSSLKTAPASFTNPPNGYNALTDLTSAKTDGAWTASMKTRTNKPLTFLAAAVPGTEVFFGKGHLNTKPVEEHTPAIVARRENLKEAIFGSATDISATSSGYVKGVTQEGNLQAGYGLLKVQTAKGTDLCFTSYRPGKWQASGLETDAQQAFVLMDGSNVRAMYLGGGTSLKTAGAAITRSVPGLACVEKTGDGNFIVANPSSSEAQVTVTLPALSGLKAFNLDDQGHQTGPASVQSGAASSYTITLPAASKVEFAQK